MAVGSPVKRPGDVSFVPEHCGMWIHYVGLLNTHFTVCCMCTKICEGCVLCGRIRFELS